MSNGTTVEAAINGKAASNHTHTAAQVGALATNGTAVAATKLATTRSIRTNLASTAAANFNGTANITPGVSGVLPVANGGTGTNSLASLAAAMGSSPWTISDGIRLEYSVSSGQSTTISVAGINALLITSVSVSAKHASSGSYAGDYSGGAMPCMILVTPGESSYFSILREYNSKYYYMLLSTITIQIDSNSNLSIKTVGTIKYVAPADPQLTATGCTVNLQTIK